VRAWVRAQNVQEKEKKCAVNTQPRAGLQQIIFQRRYH
jgi:hypothetical protein